MKTTSLIPDWVVPSIANQGRFREAALKARSRYAFFNLPQSIERRVSGGLLTCNHLVAYYRGVDEVFKALADRSRRSLLDRLHANNGQTLGELCEHLEMTRQAVTKHLAILEAANLVVTVRRGREKFHYLNPVPIHEISERWIGKYERDRLQALAELKKRLNKEKKDG